MYAMEWPLLGNVQALDLRVPVSPVMATQLKAKNTVYSTVRPEFIYLGLEFRVQLREFRMSSVRLLSIRLSSQRLLELKRFGIRGMELGVRRLPGLQRL
jgi:hypothetical protein